MGKNSKENRIIYVIDSLGRGGAQAALIYLIQALSKKNYKQRIYSLNNVIHPEHEQALIECGTELRVIGKISLSSGIGLLRMLYDWVTWKPTIVFTLLFYSDVIGRSIAKIAFIPIIVSSIRARNIDKKSWQLHLDRVTAPWADKVIFNSKNTIPFAIQNEGVQEEQVVYIPNGVNIESFKAFQIKRLTKCDELGISAEALIIGSIGRLNPQKGFSYLLQAFQIIQQRFPQCLLLIIGSGALLKTLESLVEKMNLSTKVKFLGERTDIPELLSCMDVYVQSSLFEGMPNTVMEAMATGKPVVATSVDGSLELIEEGKTGWLVEPRNSKLLAEKICDVLNNPEIAKQVGLAAAERMTKEFSIEKMAQSYNNLFHKLIKDKL